MSAMRNGRSFRPTSSSFPSTPANVGMSYEMCSMPCATSSAVAARRGSSRTICPLGHWSVSKRNASSGRGASRPWCTTCACCCAWPMGGRRMRPPSCSTVGPSNRPPPVGGMPATTAPNVKRGEGAYGRRCARPPPGPTGHAGQPAGSRSGRSLAHALQEVSHRHVELAYVDQGYTGEAPA